MISTIIYSENSSDNIELLHNTRDDLISIIAHEYNEEPFIIEFHREDMVKFAKQILKVCEL